MRGLFWVSLITLSLVNGGVKAVETLSAEDEADIFGAPVTQTVKTGGAEYIEFSPRARVLKQSNAVDDVYEIKEGSGKAVVYGSAHLSGGYVRDEERDRPVFVSPFAEYKPEASRSNALFESYKNMVADCGGRDQELDESLKEFKSASSLAAVTAVLADEGACYQDVGHAIIEGLYRGDEAKWLAFEKQAKRFYLRADSVDFNAKHCDENCSVKALVAAQKEKFGDFKQYLYRLIDEAAKMSLLNVEGQN
ncbi:MAG: hypothetical protein J6C85_00765 [Alphaproteobacteria bacterium]|nr:hypothetical protein [Alphaproteobacteria bacterium]